jgi:hypothetical protein
VNYATANGSALAGTDYLAASGTFNFATNQTSTNLTITILDDSIFEGNQTFTVRLSNPTAGATLGYPATASITIVEVEHVGSVASVTGTPLPGPLQPATGALSVSFPSPPTNGGWRLAGQSSYQNSGAVVSNLITGNYRVEFAPSFGYRRPDAMIAAVTSGTTLFLTNVYTPSAGGGYGFVTLLVCPDDVASTNTAVTNRCQWRVPGWSDWLNSGDFTTNIPEGVYPIQFKDIPGYATPTGGPLNVYPYDGSRFLGIYQLTNEGTVNTPTVVPFQSAISNQVYVYNGQLQTSLGFGSGVVVLDKVVLTAAHLLFNPEDLSFVNKVRWYFQRYAGNYEPVPLLARGAYVFSSYAAQRALDPDTCVMSLQSQNLDAAALFFLQSAGRGGYSGYLVSDATNNWLLSGQEKLLTGYAMEVIPQTNQGKLLGTAITNLTFSQVNSNFDLYSTTNASGYPSMAGGPLLVQYTDGNYYPAGIYLGPMVSSLFNTNSPRIPARLIASPLISSPSTNGTLVLLIGTNTTDLINDAAQAGSGSPGVAVESQFTINGDITQYSDLDVYSGPPDALNNGGGQWSLSTSPSTFYKDSYKHLSISGVSSYTIGFSCVTGGTSNYAVPYRPPEQNSYNSGDWITKLRYYLSNPPPFSLKILSPTNLLLSNVGGSNTFQVYYSSALSGTTTWTPLPGGLVTLPSATPAWVPIQDTSGLGRNRFYKAQWVQCPQ